MATGTLPEASSRQGEQDKKVEAILLEIFGISAEEVKSGKTAVSQINKSKGVGSYVADGELEKVIPQYILPDFVPNEKGGKVLHRRIGERDEQAIFSFSYFY